MKKRIITLLSLTVILLCIASPVTALSLGASPTQVEFEVPGDGSTTIDIQIHYFDGDIQVSLVDIPLRIEPSVITVQAAENPVSVPLTIYGDESLGFQTYDGYIRLIAVSDGAATGGVQIITKATNITNDIPVLASEPAPIILPAVTPATEPVITISEPVVGQVPTEPVPTMQLPEGEGEAALPPILPPEPDSSLSNMTIAILAGSGVILLIVITVIILRRRRY